ncbi:MAG: glycoside hydrolase [Clostridia bacterium]|nr:glycoside hydrolase [Clostridia bacterium]
MSERRLFQVNGNLVYAINDFVKNNTFIGQEVQTDELPLYENEKHRLPIPVWDGHEDAVKCYYKTWEIAFRNLRKANPDAGFVSNFIDTAFNGFLFMWDSSFIVMFGKYGSRIFDFQRTLDNMYSHQHKDGFICREICESENGEQWSRDDPASTGPNVLPWAEWEYFLSTGNMERLSRVFDPLMAYHQWFRLNRSWPDGSYWSCGFACGMDNQPRGNGKYNVFLSHGFMSWIDTCAQQYLSADILIKMAKVLGREDEVAELYEEHELLNKTVNETMWSEKDAFYYDKNRDGSLSGVKTVGAYWALLANLVPEDRRDAFVAHLDNEKEFKRPNRVPALSADHPEYNAETGGYWKGAIWAPTNYMVLKGLEKHGYHKLAYEIACDYVGNVVKVFNEEDTVFENYAPEKAAKGEARRDFVGWTGLAPISIMFEYIFGIKPDAQARKITWHINRCERHGIEQYPLGDATVDLICEARNSADEKPVVHIKSDIPVTVEIIWNGKSEIVNA